MNLKMMSSLDSKCQDFKVEMLFFQPLYVMKLNASKFKVLPLVMISSLATKWQHLKLRGLTFHYMKKGHFNFKVLAFWSQWRYYSKFKSQGLYTIKIKYWNANGSGFNPSLIPTLQNIGNLHHKKAKMHKHMRQSVAQ